MFCCCCVFCTLKNVCILLAVRNKVYTMIKTETLEALYIFLIGGYDYLSVVNRLIAVSYM